MTFAADGTDPPSPAASRDAAAAALSAESHRRVPSDAPFFAAMIFISVLYIALIAGTFLSMSSYATWEHIVAALSDRNILFAMRLSLVTCTISTILSLWVAVPIGYLMSRYDSMGSSILGRGAKYVIDTILDIPIILPPLVVGLGLLILFQTPLGRGIEYLTQHYLGLCVAFGLFGLLIVVSVAATIGLVVAWLRIQQRGDRVWSELSTPAGFFVLAVATLVIMLATDGFPRLSGWVQARFATRITHSVPAVVLAQFMVACAFAVRTMRVTFDQINPRREHVAMTLGATRSQAFWMVVFPEARRGMMAAATLAWARSLGEFGPILVFASATRMRTEVLPTTVWLELQTGSLEAAAVVSLIMVVVAVIVLIIARACGLRKSFA